MPNKQEALYSPSNKTKPTPPNSRRYKMDKELASIIIPVFNTDLDALNRSIDSARKQEPPFEIIVIDDGSHEAIAKFLDAHYGHTPSITIVHKKNGGVSSARNEGLSIAQGAYVSFLDADDSLEPSFLNEARRLIKETKADIVLGGIAYERLTGDIEVAQMQHYDNHSGYRVITGEEIKCLIASLFDKSALNTIGLNSAMYVSSCAALFSRSTITNIRFDEDIVISEDRLFNWKAFNKADAICLASRIWYRYYQNESSSSMRVRLNAAEELAHTAESILDAGAKESSPMIRKSVEKGVYECYKQALNFSVLRKGFRLNRYGSKRKYILTILNQPCFNAFFRNFSPSSLGEKISSFFARRHLTLMILLTENIYQLLLKLKRVI